jgi:hypothetical protein
MSLFAKLDHEQKTLLSAPIYPPIPESFDLESLEVSDIVRDSIVSPFASLVIDKVARWLTGESKAFLRREISPWKGDDQVVVDRVSPNEGGDVCIVTERATGKAWRLTWKDEYGIPSIFVENREADGSFRFISRAKTGRAKPRSVGDVNAWLRQDGVDSLIELSMLMASKMPTDVRTDWKSSLYRDDRSQWPRIRGLIAADGGMPGPVSRAYLSIMYSITFYAHAKWAYSKLDELAAHLDKMGAVWGEGVMDYGYDSACAIPTSDGSVALFHDNSSTCGDERSYIAKFERIDGQPSRLSIFPIGQEEETATAVEQFVAGTAIPAFTFNFADGIQTFNVLNRGQDAMNAFRMWMTKDIEIGMKFGTLNTGFPLFEIEDEDFGPSSTVPTI